ncbi:MAG: hypothetical protein JOY78_18200 [Pseudonocardia sp.]|nr:hypothetical protein [Pseudonocardia sp.]
MTSSVLIVGLDPDLAVHARSSRERFPDLDAEVVWAGIEQNRAELGRLGFTTDFCGIDHGATAETTFREAISRRRYDIVAVGGGVRLDPALTHVLEVLVNLTHELLPQAVIVFNTGPATTTDAVGRWRPEPVPLVDAGGGLV